MNMDGRKQRWDNQRRSQHRKPPRGAWEPPMPSWEKEFYKAVGIEWGRVLQSKKYKHLYPNVIGWNDSAGKEALIDAKRRFWAKKKSLPCNVPLPDPDLYIDKIDWDAEIDPELFPDLDSLSQTYRVEEDHGPVIPSCESVMENYKNITPTGWGDADNDDDEEKIEVPHVADHSGSWDMSLKGWLVTGWQSWGGDPYRAPLFIGPPILGQSYYNGAWQGNLNNAWLFDYGFGPGYSNYAWLPNHGCGSGYPINTGGYGSNYDTVRAQVNKEGRN